MVRELGRGGMGVVWLARDTMLERDVAVKELVVPPGVPAHERPVYQQRVLREARIASQLTDPGVITVYDLVNEAGEIFIVMELIQAPNLTELVERNGPLSVVQVAKIAQQMLSALESAHEAGIVHRDVKPSNVMVPAKGTAKLTDFGIAQAVNDTRLTSIGSLVGSPAYMAPERLRDGEAAPSWDLWALGATLYFAIEGRGAYERNDTGASIAAVLTERAQVQACQGPLAGLIDGLLEPDPRLRITPEHAHRLINGAIQGDNSFIPYVSPDAEQTERMQPVTPIQGVAFRPPAEVAKKRNRLPAILTGVGALVVVAVVATVLLILNNQTGQTANPETSPTSGTVANPPPTAATPQPTVPMSTSTSQAAKSKALTAVLTFGPGGDMPGDLPIGDSCWKDWMPAKGRSIKFSQSQVGCYGPHDSQTFDWGFINGDKDSPYPSAEGLAAKCTAAFLSEKVKFPDKENVLKYWAIVPTAEAWKTRIVDGDRKFQRDYICVAAKVDGSKLDTDITEE